MNFLNGRRLAIGLGLSLLAGVSNNHAEEKQDKQKNQTGRQVRRPGGETAARTGSGTTTGNSSASSGGNPQTGRPPGNGAGGQTNTSTSATGTARSAIPAHSSETIKSSTSAN